MKMTFSSAIRPPPIDKTMNIGRFLLDARMLDQDRATVLQMMEGLIVVRAEMHWHMQAVEYFALSEKFDEIEVSDRQEVPLYVAVFERTKVPEPNTPVGTAFFSHWDRAE